MSSSLVGNIAISVVAGTIAGVSAWLLGLPFPVVLGVITGLLDLIPQVGATVAAVILVGVALTVGTAEAIVMLVIQLVYQQLENYVIYPIVYRRAVELSGFTTIVAVLIAGSLLGVVGAILAVPFAAVIKIVLREAGAPRRARMEALRRRHRARPSMARRERRPRRPHLFAGMLLPLRALWTMLRVARDARPGPARALAPGRRDRVLLSSPRAGASRTRCTSAP